jgi:hypothetical protein
MPNFINRKSYYTVNNLTRCWEWIKTLSHNGYARLWHDGRLTSASRYFYKNIKGDIPDGMQIDHLCKNRRCVNPEHLEPVSPLENIYRSKVRKLDKYQVSLIRETYNKKLMNQYELAKKYNVNQSEISRLINKKRGDYFA